MSSFEHFIVSSYCLDSFYIHKQNIVNRKIMFINYNEKNKFIEKQKKILYNKKRTLKLIDDLIRIRKEEQRLTDKQKQYRRIICRLINEGSAIKEMKENKENILKYFWDLDVFNIYHLIL